VKAMSDDDESESAGPQMHVMRMFGGAPPSAEDQVKAAKAAQGFARAALPLLYDMRERLHEFARLYIECPAMVSGLDGLPKIRKNLVLAIDALEFAADRPPPRGDKS